LLQTSAIVTMDTPDLIQVVIHVSQSLYRIFFL